MRVIGVIDIARGQAVHARGGDRSRYEPVSSPLMPAAGDAVVLARAYREQLALDECYVADLDAIGGGRLQRALVRELAAVGGLALLVDAGVRDPHSARERLDDGAHRVIVGLETLPTMGALAAIVAEVGAERVVFSLDLRDRRPIVAAGVTMDAALEPEAIVEAAVEAGVAAAIVLDVARVGSGRGPDVALLAEMRRRFAHLELIAGGGVRSREDLEQLGDVGCDGALVATALHEGRVTAAGVAALLHRRAGRPS